MLRADIDGYAAGTGVSTFQIEFHWEGDGAPEILHHKIFLNGVEPAEFFFNVTIQPNLPVPPTLPGWMKLYRSCTGIYCMYAHHLDNVFQFATLIIATVLIFFPTCTVSSEFV